MLRTTHDNWVAQGVVYTSVSHRMAAGEPPTLAYVAACRPALWNALNAWLWYCLAFLGRDSWPRRCHQQHVLITTASPSKHTQLTGFHFYFYRCEWSHSLRINIIIEIMSRRQESEIAVEYKIGCDLNSATEFFFQRKILFLALIFTFVY